MLTNKKSTLTALTLTAALTVFAGCTDEKTKALGVCEEMYNDAALRAACHYGVTKTDARMNAYTAIPSVETVKSAERELISDCKENYFSKGLESLNACENGVHALVDIAARRYNYSYPNGGYYYTDYEYSNGPVIVTPVTPARPRVIVVQGPTYYDSHTWSQPYGNYGGSYSSSGGSKSPASSSGGSTKTTSTTTTTTTTTTKTSGSGYKPSTTSGSSYGSGSSNSSSSPGRSTGSSYSTGGSSTGSSKSSGSYGGSSTSRGSSYSGSSTSSGYSSSRSSGGSSSYSGSSSSSSSRSSGRR